MSLGVLVWLIISLVSINGFNISKISTQTSSIPGSGMDKPGFSLFWSNGGTYSVMLCQEGRCCSTTELNTEDDNWEVGQVDWFVGSQVGQCRHFSVELDKPLVMRLQHKGPNAGMLKWLKIHPWHSAVEFYCEVGVRLDYTSSHASTCVLQGTESGQEAWCNGMGEFCQMRFDQFLFPGSHNSGTGQSLGSLPRCAFKNQDLNIVEQLEFGIRFFDLDVIYTTALGCSGLETGHGSHPELGLYQCYGRMDRLLGQMRDWLDIHKSEVVVLNFGNIELPKETIPKLMETLLEVFTGQDDERVKINKVFKKTGVWPTLGEAVRSNERLFVFIRDSIGAVTENELEFLKEVKVKPGDDMSFKNLSSYEVTITTSYKAGDVGSDCRFVLETNSKACQSENQTETDFLKLSLFSRFGKGGAIGTECVHKMARKCNQWVKQVILRCNYREFKPNFLLVDYPNYQGGANLNIVQVCHLVNVDRVKLMDKGKGNELLEEEENEKNMKESADNQDIIARKNLV